MSDMILDDSDANADWTKPGCSISSGPISLAPPNSPSSGVSIDGAGVIPESTPNVRKVVGDTPSGERKKNKTEYLRKLKDPDFLSSQLFPNGVPDTYSAEKIQQLLNLVSTVLSQDWPVMVDPRKTESKVVTDVLGDFELFVSQTDSHLGMIVDAVKSIIYQSLSSMTPEDRSGVPGDLARQAMKQLFGLSLDSKSKLNTRERKILSSIRDSVLSDKEGSFENRENLAYDLDKLLAIDDTSETLLWVKANEILDTLESTGYFLPEDEAAKIRKELVKFYDSASKRVKRFIFTAPTEAIPELGIKETRQGEISLDSVAKALMELFPDRNILRDDTYYLRELMIEQGVTDLHFDNGIIVSALNSDKYMGANLNRVYFVTVDGYTDKFVLKYDDGVSGYLDVIVPRIIEQAGGHTPQVVPLVSELYQAKFGLTESDKFYDRARYPFLQTFVGQNEGLIPIGTALDDPVRDYLIQAIAKAAENIEDQKKLAIEFLRYTFSNIVTFKNDTHSGNVFVAKDSGGAVTVIGFDNGYAFNMSEGPDQTPNTNSLVEDSVKYATHDVGLAWYVKQFLKENPDSEEELKGTITEWADNLRKWLESDGRKPLGEYGVWGIENPSRYQKLFEKFLNELINTDIDTIWELMLKYSPDKISTGETIADWAPKFVRDIFKG